MIHQVVYAVMRETHILRLGYPVITLGGSNSLSVMSGCPSSPSAPITSTGFVLRRHILLPVSLVFPSSLKGFRCMQRHDFPDAIQALSFWCGSAWERRSMFDVRYSLSARE